MDRTTDHEDPWEPSDPGRWPFGPEDDEPVAEVPSGRRARHAAALGGRRLHSLLLLSLAPVILATLVGLVLLWPDGKLPKLDAGLSGPAAQLDATVVSSQTQPCTGTSLRDGIFCQEISADLTSGAQAGQRVSLQIAKDKDVPTLAAGDKVVLGYIPENRATERYQLLDFQRRTPMLLLGVLFVAVLLVFGRWKGIRALAGLAVTMAVVVGFLLPAILDGANPVLVVLVGGSAAAIVALYVTLGLHVRTTVALLGTLASLGLVGVLAWVFVAVDHFTGLASEEAVLLQVGDTAVNLKGLLLAGIVLGTLGVMDDVTVTQVSAVWQLRRANPSLAPGALYRSAIAVGRDHIASTVNTLVLAYTGASLPLLLFLRQASQPLSRVLTGELIATEVVRTLVGGIGLIASVPLTTLIAALVAARSDPMEVAVDTHGH